MEGVWFSDWYTVWTPGPLSGGIIHWLGCRRKLSLKIPVISLQRVENLFFVNLMCLWTRLSGWVVGRSFSSSIWSMNCSVVSVIFASLTLLGAFTSHSELDQFGHSSVRKAMNYAVCEGFFSIHTNLITVPVCVEENLTSNLLTFLCTVRMLYCTVSLTSTVDVRTCSLEKSHKMRWYCLDVLSYLCLV